MKISVSAVVIVGCIALMVLDSCQGLSHADTTISGLAYNQTDGAPLVGYEVNLVETETPSKPLSPLIITIVDTRTMDANGNFDFGEVELKKRTRFSYTIEFNTREEDFMSNAWQEGEYEAVNTINNVTKGEENNVEIGMVANGNLKVLVYNENEYDEHDEITVYAQYTMMDPFIVGYYVGGAGYDNESHNNGAIFLGTIAGDLTLEWHVTRNGQTQVSSMDYHLEHNKHQTVEIHY